MLKFRAVAGMLATGMMILGSQGAQGQDFPGRAVHIITAEPGGGADFITRIVAQGISPGLGQPVVVENQGAASGMVAAQAVAKASPDGYLLLLYGANFWILPFLQDNVPYEPLRDFAPITQLVSSPNVLVVHPSLPARTVKELIALAKARPGELNYSTGGSGAAPHLGAELFKSMAGINIVRIPYKGTSGAINAVIGGEVQMMMPNTAQAAPHVKSGRLRAIAVTSAQPSPQFAGLPTMAAAGLPGYEASTAFGIFAPARTPEAIVRRLNQEIVQVLRREEIKQKLAASGVDAVGGTAAELATYMRAEMAKWGKLIKDVGIRGD